MGGPHENVIFKILLFQTFLEMQQFKKNMYTTDEALMYKQSYSVTTRSSAATHFCHW